MQVPRIILTCSLSAIILLLLSTASLCPARAGSYSEWQNGPSDNDTFFPIAVWLQNPSRAAQYRQAGINTYVGLWRGPTDAQLTALETAGMKVICSQNDAGLRHRDSDTIIGWMHGDEPDNAQSLGSGKGYGPPIPPAEIAADYARIRAADPTRPVLLNLGQGVAWDNWHGRGVRTRHPEDYPEYIRGGDIISFDIYPAVHSHPEVAGNLWFVARGVQRLVDWSRGDKVIWNCIECTRIQNPDRKPTPEEVRAEVWMSLVSGSQGIIYFVHEWEPRFNEAALLDDPEMLRAITALNQQITRLAPVLNSRAATPRMDVEPATPDHPVATLVRRHQDSIYLFAVNLRAHPTRRVFTVPDNLTADSVTVIDEDRVLPLEGGRFEDSFGPWAVHLYRMRIGSSR